MNKDDYDKLIENNLTEIERIKRRDNFKPKNPIVIRSLSDIQAAVQKFKPSDGNNESVLRDRLIEGFNIIKNRIEAHTKITESKEGIDFGEFEPAEMADPRAQTTWLDNMIKWNLGGIRDGLKVIWSLDGKKYEFDPYSGELSEC